MTAVLLKQEPASWHAGTKELYVFTRREGWIFFVRFSGFQSRRQSENSIGHSYTLSRPARTSASLFFWSAVFCATFVLAEQCARVSNKRGTASRFTVFSMDRRETLHSMIGGSCMNLQA